MNTNKLIRRLIILLLPLVLLFNLPAEQAAAAGKSELITKVHTSSKVIALTFDDGSDGEHLQEILDILVENDIKATFFLTGSAVKAHPDLVKRILEDGNEIGNHSYTHPYFTDLTPLQMKKELSKTETIIKKITGKTTKPYFRPPYGDFNSSVLETVGAVGYSKSIYWTIDTLDWEGLSVKSITNKVLSKASPGAIVLMHAGGGAKYTPAALPGIIKSLKEDGYQFVTIPELLNYIPTDDDPVVKDPKDNPLDTAGQYIVKAGDTLTKISKKYGVTVQQLVAVNHIENANLIYVDQVLKIPALNP